MGVVTDLTLTVRGKLLKYVFFTYLSLAAQCVCACTYDPSACLSTGQLGVRAADDRRSSSLSPTCLSACPTFRLDHPLMSAVLFLSTSLWPFFFFFLRMGLRSQIRDDRGDLSVVSVLRRSVCFFFAAPSLFDILSKPFSFWLLQFQLSTSQYQCQINFVLIHSCLQWLFCV